MSSISKEYLAGHSEKSETRLRTSQRYLAMRSMRRYWQLYLVMLPAILYFIIFKCPNGKRRSGF